MSLCILHADDTRKGGRSAQASSGPSSADCTAVVTVAIGTYLHFCGNINIEIQQAVGWKPMPLHFLLWPAKTPSASLPPPPDAAADRLHTSTVDPLRLVRLTPRDSSFHQNTICPDATQTPLPNTARSCSPRRQHTPIWSIIPSYRAQLFYQHSPAHPWPYVTTPFVRFASSRDWNHGMSTFAMRLCLAAVRPLVPCIGGPGTPAACMHCTDRSRSITDDWG